MDRRLEPIFTLIQQRRRRAYTDSLIVLLVGLALLVLPKDFVPGISIHVGVAIGLALSLAGFFWHRKVLRWPKPEADPLLELLDAHPEQLRRVHLAGRDEPLTEGSTGLPERGRQTLWLQPEEGENLRLDVPGTQLQAVLGLLAELAPAAFVPQPVPDEGLLDEAPDDGDSDHDPPR